MSIRYAQVAASQGEMPRNLNLNVEFRDTVTVSPASPTSPFASGPISPSPLNPLLLRPLSPTLSSHLIPDHAKKPQHSRDPIQTQEGRGPDIAPGHVVVVGKVPELRAPHAGVAAVDVADVGDGDDHEIAPCDLGVCGPAAEDRQCGEQEQDVAELEHEDGGAGRDRGESGHPRRRDLSVVVRLRVGEGRVPAHCAELGGEGDMLERGGF